MKRNTDRLDPADEVLTPVEAAQFAGISPRTLANLRCRGRGPRFHKPTARIVRYTRSALIEWLGGSYANTGEASAQ